MLLCWYTVFLFRCCSLLGGHSAAHAKWKRHFPSMARVVHRHDLGPGTINVVEQVIKMYTIKQLFAAIRVAIFRVDCNERAGIFVQHSRPLKATFNY